MKKNIKMERAKEDALLICTLSLQWRIKSNDEKEKDKLIIHYLLINYCLRLSAISSFSDKTNCKIYEI